ncbi:MAG: AbrB/MazE/SpoVT family DNA-binding domain-containing protein [Phormidium sp.]
MTSTSQNANIEIKTFPIRLGEQGQIIVPQVVQDRLNLTEGDMLTMIQVGELVLLTPRQPQVPQLADKITAIMEDEGVNLADLLTALQAEREAIWQEQQKDAMNHNILNQNPCRDVVYNVSTVGVIDRT